MRILSTFWAFVCIVGGIVAVATSADQGSSTSSEIVLTSTPSVSSVGEARVERARADLDEDSRTGLVLFEGAPFTGASVRSHANGIVGERIEYVAGKKHGLYQSWFADGSLAFRGMYANGRKHGSIETWWDTGAQRSASQYVEGVAHGIQREWYQSGALFKELSLDMGIESGMQQAWRENGKLYANYEAKDGRIFGLKRAQLCFTIEDEELRLADTISGD